MSPRNNLLFRLKCFFRVGGGRPFFVSARVVVRSALGFACASFGLDLYRFYVPVFCTGPLWLWPWASVDGAATSTPPIEYTMMLHPPLVVENLLPHAGTFELVDQVFTF